MHSMFPHQGSNPCSLQWKHQLLTTELLGRSPDSAVFASSPMRPVLLIRGPYFEQKGSYRSQTQMAYGGWRLGPTSELTFGLPAASGRHSLPMTVLSGRI